MVGVLVQVVKLWGESVCGVLIIMQQVMKNFLLFLDCSVECKVKELIFVNWLEQLLFKDQIFELYLNEIFLGQNSFGVVVVVQIYFNKLLFDLVLYEVVMLVVMLQVLGCYYLVCVKECVIEWCNYVLYEMWQNGYIIEVVYKFEVVLLLCLVQNGDFLVFQQ